jgi:class 3 adenylate cyclase/HAMP domain-containing protein
VLQSLRKIFQNFSVSSKLVTLVLTASLVSLLLTGLLSFGVAKHLMEEAGIERMTAMRNGRAEAIREYVEKLSDHVLTLSETRMTIDATKRLTQAFNQLSDINDGQKKDLKRYYETDFVARLKSRISGDPSATTYYPTTPNERYLKYHYAAAPTQQAAAKTSQSPAKRIKLEDAKDGSAWSSVHKEYHRRFARLGELFDYADIMLVDINTGNVVYSMAKEDDLGTNLLNGPYSDSQAAKVFREVKKSRDPFFITFGDFEAYKPSFGQTTMFVGTTVFHDEDFIGALIFQLTNERLDQLMTSSGKWKEVGLGASGETYLVGEDQTFRSSPRFFLENPKQYLEVMKSVGLSEQKLNDIKKSGTPILVQPVKTVGALKALAGKSGTSEYNDYRGKPTVGSYQPIQFGPFEWGLLSEFDQSELFSGVRNLARNLLVLAAVLIPALTLFTLWMAKAFIRPIQRLLDATEKISSGDYNIHIPVAARDEFGELATAFNTMSEKIGERDETLKLQMDENHRLLRSILPSSTVDRMKEGAADLAETHPSVSVLYAEIEGWQELSQNTSAEGSIALLNELTSALDDCSERFDVEKLQDVGSSYLAVSGLSRPRIDHEKRAVDCALAMLQVMKRFNQLHNVNVSLDIGIHGGPLTTGVVSSERLSFDIWGQTINIARGIHESPKRNVIQVSAPIVDALQGLFGFKPLPAMEVKGYGAIPIWEVEGAIDASGEGEQPQLEAHRG